MQDALFERFPSSEEPLSADVFVIKQGSKNIVYDVGSSEKARNYLSKIDNKTVVLSHFHEDHSTNVRYIEFDSLYGGKKSCEYVKCGTVVDSRIALTDEVEIVPLTTCHAKGSLMLNYKKQYLFIGDALCGCRLPDNSYGYNAGMLLSTIRELSNEDFVLAVPSHTNEIISKEDAITRLKDIYKHRVGNEPYIKEEPLQ